MSRFTDLKLYFWLIAFSIGGFIYYKFKKMSDHVFNHYLYLISLMALLSRLICVIMLAIDPTSKADMFFAGICLLSQGWLVFGTLALIQKRPAEQDHPNNRTQLAEDIEVIKAFWNDPSSPTITFIIWNVILVVLFWMSMTDFNTTSDPYGTLFQIGSYFGTAWIFSQANRENLLPEAIAKLDLLVTGFLVQGIIDAITVTEFFWSNFVILQTGFYFCECFNVHNFSRLFNYNERISFVEFSQPREGTVNLDVSHRQDEHVTPSVQELKGGNEDETHEGEEEIQAESEDA